MSQIPDIKDPKTGKMYRASCPDAYTRGDALAEMFSGAADEFYFREMKETPRPWWKGGGTVWADTGAIWQPLSGEFEVLG